MTKHCVVVTHITVEPLNIGQIWNLAFCPLSFVESLEAINFLTLLLRGLSSFGVSLLEVQLYTCTLRDTVWNKQTGLN